MIKRTFLATALSLLACAAVHAQVDVTSNPADTASGVSPSAAVVFTFSEAMVQDSVSVEFRDISNPLVALDVTTAWDAQSKVLTCSANPAFPANAMIFWSVFGDAQSGASAELQGYFNTGSGGGGDTGSGTNIITSFLVGKLHYYEQTNSVGPFLGETLRYMFGSYVSLSSNRTAQSITVAVPSTPAAKYTLFNLPLGGHPEDFYYSDYTNDLTQFEQEYPAGNYTFEVKAASSNETVNVTLPPSAQQPNAPWILNFETLTNYSPSQPLTISWKPFQGGTANDYIFVDVGTVTNTPRIMEAGALKGTATSVTFPGSLFKPNTNYSVTVGFYRYNFTTNATEFRGAYLATTTTFDINTSGGSTGGSLSMTNATWTGSGFTFDVNCTPGQTFTVESSTDLSTGVWTKYTTTNAPGNQVRISVPVVGGKPKEFYRVRNGA